MIQLTDLRLIGIHGHAGVGKDTIGAYLYATYQNVYGESFAGPLKDACSEAFGIDREEFDDQALKNVINEYWGVSPRMIAQFVGTELFRQGITHYGLQLKQSSQEFWVHRLAGRLTGALNEYKNAPYTPGDCVVISDVRFQNEYDWIIANEGIVLHVVRPGYTGNVGIQGHASEADISFHTPEATFYVDNSGTLDSLYAQVDTIIGNRLERKADDFPL